MDITATKTENRVGPLATQLSLGLAVGALVFLLSSYAAAIPLLGSFQYRTLATFAIAVIAGACVLFSWRWPTIGLVAGIMNLILSLIAAVSSISIWAPNTVDPFSAFVYGALTGTAAIGGVVLVCTSLVVRRPSLRR